MKFIGDFHIHSHYSIATSKKLIPEYIDYWAALKGIKVVGTGDFTHPGWTAELKNKIEPAEKGLFRLKNNLSLERPFNNELIKKSKTRFILTAEISCIYKKTDKVRKVHNLILAPDFETVEKIQKKLDRIGNITSDGRPILGLDSRNLLEICLEASEDIFFIPAHIWTPWFSALGAKSGFDSIKECYDDLTDNIHAVETGLSSDPPMNWMCSHLDKYTLISNSDAHSPEKLGREANLFDTDLSYKSITDSIKSGDPERFLGTIEFFPQEGKYHYDGHRKCNICWNPVQTLKHNSICPECGKKVTIGVMSRIVELSDREDIEAEKKYPFYSLVPLKEILSEICRVGPNTKRVAKQYYSILEKAGSEFDILLNTPIDRLRIQAGELISEAIKRMREHRVIIDQGYDGKFGRITFFHKNELAGAGGQNVLFEEKYSSVDSIPQKNILHDFKLDEYQSLKAQQKKTFESEEQINKKPARDILYKLNPDQLRAVEHTEGPVLVIAGPGTGKTRVLTYRIAYLLNILKVDPENILAVTFTNKAAGEMESRIKSIQKNKTNLSELTVSTFHAFGFSILKKCYEKTGRKSNFIIINESDKAWILQNRLGCSKNNLKKTLEAVSKIKRCADSSINFEDKNSKQIFQEYEDILLKENLFDLEDLINKPVQIFKEYNEVLTFYRKKYTWILIDEFQDINEAQYQMLSLLMPETDSNFFAVGDPCQAIYGFRGSDASFLNTFQKDYSNTSVYKLKTSYRCSNSILKASGNIISKQTAISFKDSESKTSENIHADSLLTGLQEGIKIRITAHTSDKSEAEFTARTIESMIGGLRFFSMDSNISQGEVTDDIQTLSDFCVLCRTSRQMDTFKKAFADHSIPFQTAGDTAFFKKSPVKEIIDLIKLAVNPGNSVLKDYLGRKNFIYADTMELLMNNIKSKKINETVNELINHLTGKIIWQNNEIKEKFLAILDEFDNTNDFLKFTSLGADIDLYNSKAEKVSLLTLHASKGLEFRCVFITGCEDGLLPYSLFKDQKPNIPEEQRLLYVGMTRAQKYLFLSYARNRFLHGMKLHLNRSPFIDSIEKELIEISKHHPCKKPNQKNNQLGLF